MEPDDVISDAPRVLLRAPPRKVLENFRQTRASSGYMIDIPEILRALGACGRASAYANMSPTEALAAATASDLDWLCCSVLSPDERVAYNEAVEPARQAWNEAIAAVLRAYDEAIAAAGRAFDEAVAPARRAYREAWNEAIAAVLRAYDEAIAAADRAFDEAIAPAARAYREACALAARAYDEATAAARRSWREVRAPAARAALLASDWWRKVISGA